jgi:hypothetical protein
MNISIVLLLVAIPFGIPGAIVGGIVGTRRQQLLSGLAIGWLAGMLGAAATGFLCIQVETVLPHHYENDVFGPVRVVDFPPERVWTIIKIGCAFMASAGLGWFAARAIGRKGEVQLQYADRRKRRKTQ